MHQCDLLGKFLQDSYIEINALRTYSLEACQSTPAELVHMLMSLLIHKSYDDLLELIHQKSVHEEFNRLHPLDIILYFIQRSSDQHKNIIFDAIMNLKIALPLAINDHIYLENFQRQSPRNELIKNKSFSFMKKIFFNHQIIFIISDELS